MFKPRVTTRPGESCRMTALPAVRDATSDWVRLRTLTLIRWIAIFGQVGAIAVADRVYGVDIALGPAFAVVGAAVIANLVAIFVFPENQRLSEFGVTATLLFDTAQIAALLYLTGGLHNPFALLIVAPATIAATALRARVTALIGGVTILLVTFVAFVHQPLALKAGGEIRVPQVFEFGFWVAIVIGVVFLGLYASRVASEIHSMGEALRATQMALAREQKLTDLGGVVAAAAHELGTPLATIKLVSAELADELDDPELKADAELIREQADRCRDILRSMGRAGKDDLHLRRAPLGAVLREAAEPHAGRGKALHILPAEEAAGQPMIHRRPEIIHGLRNLIQNAVDFARGNVWVEASWTDARIRIRIVDDGAGFPPHLIGRIGDPFMRHRRGEADRRQRPEYEGMGLGLFIAKTLLERTGAELSFANARDPFLTAEEQPERSGAIVEVTWPRARIEAPEAPTGENRPFG